MHLRKGDFGLSSSVHITKLVVTGHLEASVLGRVATEEPHWGLPTVLHLHLCTQTYPLHTHVHTHEIKSFKFGSFAVYEDLHYDWMVNCSCSKN